MACMDHNNSVIMFIRDYLYCDIAAGSFRWKWKQEWSFGVTCENGTRVRIN